MLDGVFIVKTPHLNFEEVYCPKFCPVHNTFWGQDLKEGRPTDREDILSCILDESLSEARMVWQLNFRVKERPKDNAEQIHKKIEEIIKYCGENYTYENIPPAWGTYKFRVGDKNIKIEGVIVSEACIQVILSCSCPIFQIKKLASLYPKEVFEIFMETPLKLKEYNYREIDVVLGTIRGWATLQNDEADAYFIKKYPQYKNLIEVHRKIYTEVSALPKPFEHEFCQKRIEQEIIKAYSDWKQI
jgi:hypothetical protein